MEKFIKCAHFVGEESVGRSSKKELIAINEKINEKKK
jgi:hypothetical protein